MCKIGSSGIKSLCESLKVNATLTKLNLARGHLVKSFYFIYSRIMVSKKNVLTSNNREQYWRKRSSIYQWSTRVKYNAD